MPYAGMMSVVSASISPSYDALFRNDTTPGAVALQASRIRIQSRVCAVRDNVSHRLPRTFGYGATRVRGINFDLILLGTFCNGRNQRTRTAQVQRHIVVKAQGQNEIKPEVKERSIQLYGQIERYGFFWRFFVST